MSRRTKSVLVLAVFVAVLIAAQTVAQKQAVPVQPDRVALGQNEVKQLLLLMDTDKSGKISKQEWMAYMSAEFDRLDKDRSGELDPTELAQSNIRASHLPAVGK